MVVGEAAPGDHAGKREHREPTCSWQQKVNVGLSAATAEEPMRMKALAAYAQHAESPCPADSGPARKGEARFRYALPSGGSVQAFG